MNHLPLVSVVVVTYNSSHTILETLDSIKEQNYENIELIVSDDHSSDDTVKICKDWMDEHKERFIYCQVVESPNNTGVTANVNRGWKASHGEWVKILGGDDLFLPYAVQEVMQCATPEKEIIVTQYKTFFEKNGERNIGTLHPRKEIEPFYEEDNAEHRKKIILHTFIEATIGYFKIGRAHV